MAVDGESTGKSKGRAGRRDEPDIDERVAQVRRLDVNELETIPTMVPRQGDGYQLPRSGSAGQGLGRIGEPGCTLTEDDLRRINTRRGQFKTLRMQKEQVMMNISRYAAILVWGSVVLLGPNVQTVRADGGHGGMMCGHMCEGHDQSKQDEHSSYDLKHLLKHGKEIGLTSEQISKLKTIQLDLGRAQARAEADIKVATLELHALVEDEKADSTAIQAKVDQLKKAESGLLFMAIKSRRDAMALLTPEQREKEHAIREKMMRGESQHSGGMSGMSGMQGGGHGTSGGPGKEGAATHQH